MRPANIVTSVADVLAGVAISSYLAGVSDGKSSITAIILLCIATVGLYGGGVVFNDVFDAELDRIERPERPIPSGVVTKKEASVLGTLLLLIGIVFGFLVNASSGVLACATALSAVMYDKWGKHQPVLGPLNMGMCRGLNLLLGISILPAAVSVNWYLALVPIIYIASITMISRGEVHGGSRSILYAASILYILVILAILIFSFNNGNIILAMLVLIPFSWMIFKPLTAAIKEPIGRNIGKAVKAGVIALILMNAAWAAAFGSLWIAVIIVILLPISIKLGRLFAVT